MSVPLDIGSTPPAGKVRISSNFKEAGSELAAQYDSRIAVADLQKWVRRIRDLFSLPMPEVKGNDESQWWTGYQNALVDLERFISPRSENNQTE